MILSHLIIWALIAGLFFGAVAVYIMWRDLP